MLQEFLRHGKNGQTNLILISGRAPVLPPFFPRSSPLFPHSGPVPSLTPPPLAPLSNSRKALTWVPL